MAKTTDQKIGQLADIAQKEFGRFCARMRRLGHDKPNKQLSAQEAEKLDPTTKTLYDRWVEAEHALERETQNPSQPTISGLDGKDDLEEVKNQRDLDQRADYLNRVIRQQVEKIGRTIDVTAERFKELEELDSRDLLEDADKKDAIAQVRVAKLDDRRLLIIGYVPHSSEAVNGVAVAYEVTENLKSIPVSDHTNRLTLTKPNANHRGLLVKGPGRKKLLVTGEVFAVVVKDVVAEAMKDDIESQKNGKKPKPSPKAKKAK